MFSFKAMNLILIMGMMAGCGDPELTDQFQDEIKVPTVPESDLNLQGTTVQLDLVGFVVFWQQQVTPAGMAGVLNAVFEDRAAKVKALDHWRKDYHEAVEREAAARAQVEDHERYLQETFGSSDLLRQGRLEKAGAFFGNRFEELLQAGETIESDRAKSQQHFYAYCESKVWELAVSNLAQASWYRRPTPHLMCEGYYQSKGYFEYGDEGSDLCSANEKDGVGRSYFHCLWQEGVMRTQLFGSYYDDACKPAHPMTKKDQLQQWLDQGVLAQALGDPELGRQMRTAILSRARIPFDVTRAYEVLKNCSALFRLADSPNPEDWTQALPLDLRNDVEAEQLVARKFPLLSQTGDLNTDRRRWQLLSRDLLLTGERPNDEPSLSDYWWVPEAGLPKPRAFDLAQARPTLAEFFEGFEALVPAEERSRSLALRTDWEAAQVELKLAEAKQVELREEVGRAQDRGARAAREPLVSSGFAKMNGELILKDGAPQSFKVGETLGKAFEMKIQRFDPETAVMEFIYDAPESLLGLAERPRREGDPYFLDQGHPLPKKITGQLAVRRVDGALWAVTGELTLVQEEGQDPLFGALTLDNYSQERKTPGLEQGVDESNAAW